eukprot:gnl/TRDRNA2_/TRDRNA2_137304_c0_seq1.p1 gnl/TRDRNA2_/TRDRNA2_137304_c0~~gnl/TRDRNA2_/TRDRNA2_137304_c0_seq1.p1  ORF type:complete len:401 (+),score=46.53 gnl/TRDRNA2_/TRDRNA2_137304_c0_seq1:47-1249(+)
MTGDTAADLPQGSSGLPACAQQRQKRQKEVWQSGFQCWQERRRSEAGERFYRSIRESSRALQLPSCTPASAEHRGSASREGCQTAGAAVKADLPLGVRMGLRSCWDLDVGVAAASDTASSSSVPSSCVRQQSRMPEAAKRESAHFGGPRLSSTTRVPEATSRDGLRSEWSKDAGAAFRQLAECGPPRRRLHDVPLGVHGLPFSIEPWIPRHKGACDLAARSSVGSADCMARLRQKNDSEHAFANPHTIQFVNPTIIDRFSCGRSVETTIEELATGKTSVTAIPAIRVIRGSRGGLATLDHRRLHAFRAALPHDATVPVVIVAPEALDFPPPPEHKWHNRVNLERTFNSRTSTTTAHCRADPEQQPLLSPLALAGSSSCPSIGISAWRGINDPLPRPSLEG